MPPSEQRRRGEVRALLALGLVLGLVCGNSAVARAAATAGLPAAADGAVSGTVEVSQARVKTTDPKGGKEVVVYLEPLAGKMSAGPQEISVMDQRGLIFIPHVLPVRRGTTVEFLNNDNVEHNVYLLDERSGKTLDLGTWPQGVSVKHTFAEPGTAIILCKLHLEMAAYVVALDTPWFTTAILEENSQKAVFRFDRIPPGDYLVQAWHKKLQLKQPAPKITVTAGEESQARLVITKQKYAQ